MLTSNLACGPMSQEIIEAVFRHSHKFGQQLMLICSRNQVDKDSGYVFITSQYVDYLAKMKRKYPQSDVVICRDHCGPGFGGADDSLESVKTTIRCDLEHGFDLIHIDLCMASSWSEDGVRQYPMDHDDKLKHTTELMQFALDIKSDVMFEIGTDENIGVAENNVYRIIADIQTCQQVAHPAFYVVQTGSLVRETNNVGSFDRNKVLAMHQALKKCGVKLKEHNADYLTSEQLRDRCGIVDAVNIAPQLGVVQTSHVLSQALIYGIDTQPFINEVAEGRKWIKWLNNPQNRYSGKMLCATIAGHYHFNGPAYKQLIAQLAQKTSIRESIIRAVTNVIEYYLFSLE